MRAEGARTAEPVHSGGGEGGKVRLGEGAETRSAAATAPQSDFFPFLGS